MSETGAKSDPAFCLGPTIEKTNSDSSYLSSTFIIHKLVLKVMKSFGYESTK